MVMRPDGGAPVRGAVKPKSSSSSRSGNTFGSFMQAAMNRAREVAPQVRQTYTQQRSGGGGGGYSGGGGGGGGGIQAPSYSGGGVSTLSTGIVAEPQEPPKPSLEDWRAKDATYNAANQTISTDLQSLLRQLADENAKYNQDYDMGLRNLGWDATAGDGKGAWNPQDLLGAYGQANNNLFNDFSGRGLLDSSFFTTAQGDMLRNFERQRSDMGADRKRVMDEYGAAQGRANQDAQNARQQALADAAARYGALYGV